MALGHPLQQQLWTILDRVQVPKAWAVDLGVDASEISRWRGGQRSMSLDQLVGAIRIAKQQGCHEAGERLFEMLREVTETTEERRSVPPPLAIVAGAAKAAGATAEAVQDVYADGKASGSDEATALDRAAEFHERVAKHLRGAALQARSAA